MAHTAYDVQITAASKDMLHQTMRITETLNGRNTLAIDILSAAGAYRPARGAKITVDEGSGPTRIFAGNIITPKEEGFGGIGGPDIVTRIEGVDYNARADRHYFKGTLPAGTLKSKLLILVTYLPNTTLDPVQATGPTTLPAQTYVDYTSISDILDELTQLTNYAYFWEVTYTELLRMKLASGNTAPFNIATNDGNVIGDITVEPTSEDYANQIIYQYNAAALTAYAFMLMNSNPANGNTVTVGAQTYTFESAFSNTSGKVLIGANRDDSLLNLISAISSDPGGDGSVWGHGTPPNTQATAFIFRDLSYHSLQAKALAPGAAGNSIAVSTSGAFATWFTEGGGPTATLLFGADEALTNEIVKNDLVEQAAFGEVIPKIIKDSTVLDFAVADAIAAAELVRSVAVPKKITYTTDQTGIHPGMVQTVTVSERALTGSFIVTDVVVTNITGGISRRMVTASGGIALPIMWQNFAKRFFSGTSGSGSGGGTVVLTGGGGGGTTENVAYINVPNIFITGQTIAGADPYLYFYEDDVGVNLKRWRWIATGSNFYLQTIDDAATAVLASPMAITRAGAVTFLSTVTGTSFIGSGASLTNLNASNIATGTLAGARLPQFTGGDITTPGAGSIVLSVGAGVILNTHVNAAAAIAWTKLDKTGSSLVDLTTRSATDLSSGNLAYARMPTSSGTWTATPTISGAVTLQSTLDVTGLATFTTHVFPATSDTSDLGRYDRIWNQAYISQLNAIVYALTTQTLFGGYSTIGKNAGSFAAAVASANTTINFGQSMTVGNWVLVRAHDTAGVIKAEYITVGTLVSGTTYNVTRDVAAANSPDPAWAAGTPYLVLGASGDGRIDMYAYDGKPRIQFVTQGATATAQNNRAIIGNMNTYYGYVTDVYGMAAGDEAGPNITVDATNGVRIRSGTTDYVKMSSTTFVLGAAAGNRVAWDGTNLTVVSANLTINSSGVAITPNTGTAPVLTSSYSYTIPTGSLFMAGGDDSSNGRNLWLWSKWTGASTRFTTIDLTCDGNGGTSASWFVQDSGSGTSQITGLVTGGTYVFRISAAGLTWNNHINFSSGDLTLSGQFKQNGAFTQTTSSVVYPGSVSGLSNYQTTYYIASTSATSGLFTNGSFDAAAAFVGRQGSTGATAGNKFTIWWTATQAELWIDTTRIGTINTTPVPSDRRVKKNIRPLGVGLAEVLALKPSSFEWRNKTDPSGIQYGLVAQDVTHILPDITTQMKGMEIKGCADGLWRIDYMALIPVLVRSIQELHAKLEKAGLA